jgi:hypothetical protein
VILREAGEARCPSWLTAHFLERHYASARGLEAGCK